MQCVCYGYLSYYQLSDAKGVSTPMVGGWKSMGVNMFLIYIFIEQLLEFFNMFLLLSQGIVTVTRFVNSSSSLLRNTKSSSTNIRYPKVLSLMVCCCNLPRPIKHSLIRLIVLQTGRIILMIEGPPLVLVYIWCLIEFPGRLRSNS